MKPRIFIGSSREGRLTAEAIKKHFSDFADCQIWDEDFFEYNKSSFESLNEGAVLFDFAILVATSDDIQLKRDKLELVARDNIIFEFGLYIGRLGKNRAFFVKSKGLDLPSDFYGITLPEYKISAADHGRTLEEVCDSLLGQIKKTWELFELSFVPSTVLAFGYFENFLLSVCRELSQTTKRQVDERLYDKFKLHVVIPDELPDNFQDQVIDYLNRNNLKEMKVETVTRKYNFYLEYSDEDSDTLNLYDLPTTLSALKKAIEMAIPAGHIGEHSKQTILKKKEMFNFCRTLKYLVKSNAVTRHTVEIIFIDVN